MRVLRAVLGFVSLLLSLLFAFDAFILINTSDIVRLSIFSVFSIVFGYFGLRWIRA
jgi:hypothetical protein